MKNRPNRSIQRNASAASLSVGNVLGSALLISNVGQNMSTKVYSTFFTVNWLLGLAGATVSGVVFSLMAFSQGLPLIGAPLLAVVICMILFASRVSFPKEEEVSANSVSAAQVIGGPILHVCFFKMQGRWRWFCISPGSRSAFERALLSMAKKEPNQSPL